MGKRQSVRTGTETNAWLLLWNMTVVISGHLPSGAGRLYSCVMSNRPHRQSSRDDFVGLPHHASAWARPYFGPGELSKFKAMVSAVLSDLGYSGFVFSDGDTLVTFVPDERGLSAQAGLLNLASACHAGPSSSWPSLIRSHFETILSSANGINTQATWDVARPQLKLRLYGPDYLPAGSEGTLVVRNLDPELFVALVLDQPDTIRSVSRSELAVWGVTEEEAWAHALDNLRAERPHHSQQQMPGNGPVLGVLSGGSFFVASWLLLLDEIAPTGAPYGLIVAVPRRHNLIYHVIDKGPEFRDAVLALSQIAHGMHRDGPGSITPTIYWCKRDGLTPIPIMLGEIAGLGSAMSIGLPPELIALAEDDPDAPARPN